MARKSTGKEGLAAGAREAVSVLGANLRTARRRRGIGLSEMAASMMVTRKTLSRLETGDPSVGLAVLAAALHVLGLQGDLKSVAAPEKDEVGIFAERRYLPERVRRKQAPDDDLDF